MKRDIDYFVFFLRKLLHFFIFWGVYLKFGIFIASIICRLVDYESFELNSLGLFIYVFAAFRSSRFRPSLDYFPSTFS